MKTENHNGWKNFATLLAYSYLTDDNAFLDYFNDEKIDILANCHNPDDQIDFLSRSIWVYVYDHCPHDERGLYDALLGFAVGSINYHEIAEFMLKE